MGRERGRRKKTGGEDSTLGAYSAELKCLREIQPENLTVADGDGEREEKIMRREREWRERGRERLRCVNSWSRQLGSQFNCSVHVWTYFDMIYSSSA